MAFMTLEVILFRKKIKSYLLLPFFVYLLPILINERPYTTLSVSEECAIKHILRAKIWLYGFDSVFWQVTPIDALVIVNLWDILLDFEVFITL